MEKTNEIHVPLPNLGKGNYEDRFFEHEQADGYSETTFAQIGPPAPSSQERVPDSKAPTVVDKRRSYDDSPVEPQPFLHEPIGDTIVVKRIPTPVGLIIEADIAQDKPVDCEVVAVSKHASTYLAEDALSALQPGDKVLIRRYAGTEVKVNGEEFTIVLVFDVLLKLQ